MGKRGAQLLATAASVTFDAMKLAAVAAGTVTGFTELAAVTMLTASTMLNAYSFVESVMRHGPSLFKGGFDVGENKSDQMQGLPIPYGQTGTSISNVLAGQTAHGQPAFGLNIVSVTTQGANHENRYLWITGAVCHGPVKSVDAIYLDGNLAAVVSNANGPVRMVSNQAEANLGVSQDYSGVVAAWVAYGTDGQATCVPNDRGPFTVSNSVQVDSVTRQITTNTVHPFVAGDCVMCLNVHGLDNAVLRYIVRARIDDQNFTVLVPEGAGGASGSGGTVDFNTPWQTSPGDVHMMGKGVCWVTLRLTFDTNKFPNGVPRVSVGVSGICGIDPRSSTTVNIATTSDGGVFGTPGLYGSHIANVTTATNHGCAEGDIVLIAGTGTYIDGYQRVDRVVSPTQIQTIVNDALSVIDGPSLPTTHTGTLTTTVNIENPAIAIRDYLTNQRYGLGAPQTEMDDAKFIAAANLCDTLVYAPDPNRNFATTQLNSRSITATTPSGSDTILTVNDTTDYNVGDTVLIQNCSQTALNVRTTISSITDGTHFVVPIASGGAGTGGALQRQIQQKQFQLSGFISSTDTLKSNLERLCMACRGVVVYQAGLYAPSIRQATTTVMTLTQDHIIGGWSFKLPGQQQMVNVLRGTYLNPDRGYQFDQTLWPPSVTGDAFVVANGFLATDQNQLNLRDIELPVMDNLSRVNQILMVIRRESRVARQVSLTCKEIALQLAVGDLVGITHETPGWTNQPHWVTSIAPLIDGSVQLTLEGYDATSYDLDAMDDLPFAAATNLPDPLAISPPSSLAVSTASTSQRALQVTWAASPTATVVNYQAQFRVNGTTTWHEAFLVQADQTTAFITDLANGTAYDVQLRAIGLSGAVSTWVEVDDTTLTGLVTGGIAQGTVSVSPDGSWTAEIDLPAGAASAKYIAQTGSFPADVTVETSGTPVSGTPISITGVVLTPGQAIYLTIVPYTGAGGTGTAMASSHVVSVVYNPNVAVGTISVAADGTWSAVVDLPRSAASCKYLAQTSGFASDATVVSSGSTFTGAQLTASGGPLTSGQTIYLAVVPFTGSGAAGTQLSSTHLQTSPYVPGVAQGTVSVDANGNWNTVVDLPQNAQSARYIAQVGSFPADATVASSGTPTAGAPIVLAGGPLLTGQAIYVTVVPFAGTGGTGTQLPAIHVRSAQFLPSLVTGSISVAGDGTYSAYFDLPPSAASCKYIAQTGSMPADATVVASGTTSNANPLVLPPAALAQGAVLYVTVVPFTGAGATGTQLPSGHFQSDPYSPNTAQGTVSIDSNGAWSFAVDGPFNAQSCKWSASSSSFPADATVAAGGPGVNTVTGGRAWTGNSTQQLGALAFGSTVFITVIPYTGASGAGTQLPSIHIRGSYLTFSASKTLNFSASSSVLETEQGNDWGYDANGNLLPFSGPNVSGIPAQNNFHHGLYGIPGGTTGVNIVGAAWTVYNDPTSACDITMALIRSVTSSQTQIASAGLSSVSTGWQTMTAILNENTNGRNYNVRHQYLGGVGLTKYAGLALTYSMSDPKQTS